MLTARLHSLADNARVHHDTDPASNPLRRVSGTYGSFY